MAPLSIQLYETSLRNRVICIQNLAHFLGWDLPGLLHPEQDGVAYESLATQLTRETRPTSDRTSLTLLQTQEIQREFVNDVQGEIWDTSDVQVSWDW